MKLKKVGIVLFTVLFVGVVCLVPCFAINYDNVVFNEELIFSDIDVESFFNIYSDEEITPLDNFNFNYVDGAYILSFSMQYAYDCGGEIYFYNYSEDLDYYFLVSSFSGYVNFNQDNYFTLSYNDEYILRFTFNVDSFYEDDVISIIVSESPIPVPSDYSVYNVSSLIGIISNLGTLIFNSPIFIVLFFIGVTCSLGFVAVRIIRKVMWGN